MSILSPEEHKQCYFYAHESTPLLKKHFLLPEQNISERLNANIIIFVIEGRIRLVSSILPLTDMAGGEMVFFPIGSHFTITALSRSRIILMNIQTGVNLCEGLSFQNLFNIGSKKEPLGGIISIHHKIEKYLHCTCGYLDEGLLCTKFMEFKSRELMYLFSAYYTREELSSFFRPILSRDHRFANLVLQHWPSCKSVNELAVACNYTPKAFSRKFRDVFGVLPYSWLNARRAAGVYHELINSTMAIKEIADIFRFNSIQHFNEYCVNNFGKPPGILRKKHGVGADN